MEKIHARRNHIDVIEVNGVEFTDNDSIGRAFCKHYEALFTATPVDSEVFKQEFLRRMPQLSNDAKAALELPISQTEIERAIDKMNPGKSPGPDGLSASFYKAFKNELSQVLTNVFNEAYELDGLPRSFSEAHTVLIPKTEQSEKLKLVSSYRPISLTNCDYKILMKVLARRLQGVIKKLVGPHQTCGIMGRSIVTNIHKMRCVLECCDANQGGVAILQIDLEKAFDSVSHVLLLAILEHVNVGSVIRDGVAMAYRNCTTRLVVNKSLGTPINIRRSVRQGCPLSPLLFSLYIESLCLAITENSSIHGFKLQASEVKVLAYADDVAVCCTDQESGSATITVVKSFGNATGSLVNLGKCLGFWHGEWPSRPDYFANVKWVTTPVKYLGVPLEYYKDNENYWQEQAREIQLKANGWNGNHLSMFSRATVCNLFFAAKLWYVMQVLHCSRANIQKLHRVFAVFVWASNWERCSRTNLFRRVKQGGLGLPHLFIRQVVNRFLFFRNTNDPFLRTVCQLRLMRALPGYVVGTNNMTGAVCGYLREVILSVRFLSVRFSNEYLF